MDIRVFGQTAEAYTEEWVQFEHLKRLAPKRSAVVSCIDSNLPSTREVQSHCGGKQTSRNQQRRPRPNTRTYRYDSHGHQSHKGSTRVREIDAVDQCAFRQ